MLPDIFLLFSFSCSADHERDWSPCKVVFFGLATNTLNVRNNSNNKYVPVVFGIHSAHDCDAEGGSG